ncbi:hypothetical protein AEGHOMDF_5157 [Methylobacterium soli]|nr:hypothetical protein AEGHOMDF_5157 [Methylobacterium soli]
MTDNIGGVSAAAHETGNLAEAVKGVALNLAQRATQLHGSIEEFLKAG